jgi:hypothetical protein
MGVSIVRATVGIGRTMMSAMLNVVLGAISTRSIMLSRIEALLASVDPKKLISQ